MALRRRGNQSEGLNVWPGYVDALSTLLMVIIFVLLVFVLAQAFLSVTLSGRDQMLDRLNRQLAELSDMLSLEKGRSAELRTSIGQLGRDLQAATATRDTLSQQLAALRGEQARLSADRDALKSDRDKLAARLADTDLQSQAARARSEQLQQQLADAAKRGDVSAEQTAATAAQLADTKRQLATAQANLAATQASLAEMQRQAAELDRTVQSDRATIAARLSDLASMTDQVRNLTALRAELEKQVQDAAVRATTEEQRRAALEVELAGEKKYGESARAQMAAMTAQMEQLRDQMDKIAHALEASEASDKDKDAQIANLSSRLNTALAQKLEELQRYRSDFFGRLREVLANRPGIQVVGDRFVFQSEVLFPVGSADLTAAGQDQMNELAATLKDIAREIPPDVNWLLRVDGHADRQPVAGGVFASNWELSSARAITVVKLLIADGIAANRVAATGFADNQPLDPGDTPDAYAKNRRIEIRLTDR